MQTLQIEKPNALKAFNAADEKGKSLLSNLFGKEVFSQKITDRVKTFEDACAIKGTFASSIISRSDSPDESAYKKIKLIAEVLNEGWKPDWTDSGEYKYYSYFDMTSGSGLSFGGYGRWDSHAGVGSRLCFKSRELAEYAGKQFEKIYQDFFCF